MFVYKCSCSKEMYPPFHALVLLAFTFHMLTDIFIFNLGTPILNCGKVQKYITEKKKDNFLQKFWKYNGHIQSC